jgi:hypothetical protein
MTKPDDGLINIPSSAFRASGWGRDVEAEKKRIRKRILGA